MYVLDTNVVSELRKVGNNKADVNVVGWVKTIPAHQLYITTINLLELETGILRLERKDKQQAEGIRQWYEQQVLVAFSGRILPIDIAVARQCARLNVPNPKSYADALIAAAAMVHGFTVVTRNIDDFSATGVPLLNPWISR